MDRKQKRVCKIKRTRGMKNKEEKEEGKRRNEDWSGRMRVGREAPLVLISRNAELGNVSDFWWPDSTRPTSGARLFFIAPAPSLKRLRFHKGRLAVFVLVSWFHQTFLRGAQE